MAEIEFDTYAGVRITISDRFRELTADQKKQVFGPTNPKQQALWDQERHLMITSEYRKVVPWDSLNISAKNTEKKMAKKASHYQKIRFEREMNGTFPFYVLEYTYQIGEITEHAWTLIFLHKGRLATITFLTRDNSAAEMADEIQRGIRSVRPAEG